MDFDNALDLFQRTLATERSRPDVHAAMLALALPDTIGTVSTQIQQALARDERVWMTADLHLCHANVIRYLAARSADMPSYLVDVSHIPEGMGMPSQPTAARIWFTQIWLLHLDLLYTQIDRSPSERGRWLNASFTRQMLQDAVHAFINDRVRKLNATQLENSEVYDVLCAEKGTEISKRVKRFLDLMCKGGLLEERDEGAYRQTLLSAVEMKENYDRSLAPLMLAAEQDGQRAALGQIAEALLTTAPEMLPEGGVQ